MSELDDLYDWAEVDALVATFPPRRTTRRGSLVLTAALLAVGDVLDPRQERDVIVEESPDPGLDESLPVIVHLVRGQPSLAYALVRDAGW